jgi:hypothetical protein
MDTVLNMNKVDFQSCDFTTMTISYLISLSRSDMEVISGQGSSQQHWFEWSRCLQAINNVICIVDMWLGASLHSSIWQFQTMIEALVYFHKHFLVQSGFWKTHNEYCTYVWLHQIRLFTFFFCLCILSLWELYHASPTVTGSTWHIIGYGWVLGYGFQGHIIHICLIYI